MKTYWIAGCFILYLLPCSGQIMSGLLKGSLYYSLENGKRRPGSELKIFLIPKISKNDSIIKATSNNNVSCDEKTLKMAEGYKISISDKKGQYYFTNVGRGSYFIKICTYRGAYYSFRIKSDFNGKISLPEYKVNRIN